MEVLDYRGVTACGMWSLAKAWLWCYGSLGSLRACIEFSVTVHADWLTSGM